MAESNALAKPSPWHLPFSLAVLGDLGVPLAVLAIVIALITPLPSFLLDVLIVTDIMLSVIVMMVSMYITRPVEFSVFPTMLLLLTLFRLALNVSSSRLILLNGNSGTGAAGDVIEALKRGDVVALYAALEAAITYLACHAQRAHPARDRQSGRMQLGLEPYFEHDDGIEFAEAA